MYRIYINTTISSAECGERGNPQCRVSELGLLHSKKLFLKDTVEIQCMKLVQALVTSIAQDWCLSIITEELNSTQTSGLYSLTIL